MKLTLALLTFAVTALAQDDRVVVPASKSARPRLIDIHTLNGGVTVKASSSKEIIVESHASSKPVRDRRRGPDEVDGMKRVELPGGNGLDIEAEDSQVNIRTRNSNTGDLVVTVPAESSVTIHCTMGGDIVVNGVHGEVDAHNLSGNITLTNISGTVVAHSLNGAIKATMDRVDPAKPISFSTMNGEVDVTLPADFRANLKMKTDNGDIYSDFDIKLAASRATPVNEGGRFHLQG